MAAVNAEIILNASDDVEAADKGDTPYVEEIAEPEARCLTSTRASGPSSASLARR